MRLSPSGTGIIIGVVICLILVVVFSVGAFLAKSQYSISGNVVVSMIDYESPGANVSVYLIEPTVQSDLDRMVADYSAFQNSRQSQAVVALVSSIEALKKPKVEVAEEKFDIQNFLEGSLESSEKISLEDEIYRQLKEEPQPDELEEISNRISLYNQNANYCRQQGEFCTTGGEFYLEAADFWQAKADRLKEKGRIVYDDATFAYKTALSSGGGLGNESRQTVRRIQKVNLEKLELALARLASEENPEKVEVKEVKVVKPVYNYDTNAVLLAAVNTERLLKDDFHLIVAGTSEVLKEKIIQTTKTDIDGNFEFKGTLIKPGEYFIFGQYDVLSSDGETIEFTWFKKISIPNLKFKFNKNIKYNLNEINQSRPKTLDIEVPDKEELFALFCTKIEENLDN